jgi:NhaP-type Na+/H+ or K+/H+ antiporter
VKSRAAATADTSVFFQVGLDIALTMGTDRGIDTGAQGEMVGWVVLAMVVARTLTIFPLAFFINYFRREPVPWQHVVVLWHSSMRGANSYAFALVFPTSNQPFLVDLTASVILISVAFYAPTTKLLLRVLGLADDAHAHGDGHQAEATGRFLPTEADDSDSADDADQATHGEAPGPKNYDVVIVSGARVYIPKVLSRSERVVTWINRLDTQLRWLVSGIVR